jgi:hypothetical protein
MKIFKILFVLFLGSLQAQATGYAHNMFVAQKKLNTKKEAVVEKSPEAHLPKSKQEDVKMKKQIASPTYIVGGQLADGFSLNPATFDENAIFSTDAQAESKSLLTSTATKVVLFLKNSIYAFLLSFH